MWYDRGHQLNTGELKKLLQFVPDNIPLFVGLGNETKPLRYLCEHDKGIMFHTELYETNADENNLKTILMFSNKK